ncbi:ABC transporter permease [Enterovirga rhinocerotis]|uniref:Putative spermidine/putrescine transport system permease protein n=1 Tax=Enterovirga rhinocerotis TaxID=1339210 RepID=A0A4R7BX92_9HYPH|nr:ABC transporter permease [Enterovirga rhinocerotis]TDR90201.1 putative spermidine/putrescine transport system permease protein [Enterovirga rhinocerotis]
MPAATLVVPACLLVTALLVGPMVYLGRISLNHYDASSMMTEALTLENYVRAVADPYYRGVMATTLTMALVCTTTTLILGFPVAYWIARMQSSWKSLVTVMTLMPLLVGNVVRVAGWVGLLGNQGFVNAGLQGVGLIDEPIRILYTPFAVALGTVAVVLPYMILTLASVIEAIPRNVEEAAANLGAPPATVFSRVVWPLALPGVAAGCTLVFILCMNTFATAVLLGGSQFKMMAPAVYDQFSKGSNWPFGAALAFILLIATLTLTVLGSVLIARRSRRRVAA